MRAGQLRKRVQWQQRTVTTDSYGQAQETWSTVASCWASFKPGKGNEQEVAKEQRSYSPFEIRVRWPGGISFSTDDRILYGSRTFNIQNINNVDERNRELVVAAVEVV